MSISFFLDKTATLERQASGISADGSTIVLPFSTVTANIPMAIWRTPSYLVNTFMRRDIIGDTILATNQQLNVYPGDRFEVPAGSGTYYVVNGQELYENAPVLFEKLWLYDTTLKIV